MKLHTLLYIALLGTSATAWCGNPAVDAVKKEFAPDGRQVVFDIKTSKDASGRLVVSGVTSDSVAYNALLSRFNASGLKYVDSVKVFPYDNMALVSIPVATLRTRGAHAGEMASQAVMGTPVRILERVGEWLRIQTPDGYIAYVPDSSVAPKTMTEMQAWRSDDNRRIVNSLWQTRAYTTPEASGPRDVVTDLVLGAIVEVNPSQPVTNGRVEIILPDGRRGWADRDVLTPVTEWAAQTFDADKILDTAYSLEGSPYLWGGTSIKSVDCSGLVKVSYYNNGLILRRDASQQALTGQQLDVDRPDYRAGDLLFFGNAKTGRITHVAIYDSSNRFVHSSGRVKRNSLDKNDPLYLYSPLKAVRIHGSEGTDGIVPVAAHPWYF